MRKIFILMLAALTLGKGYAQKTLTLGSDDLRIRFDGRITFDAAAAATHTPLDDMAYGKDNLRLSSGANLTQLRLGLVASLGSKWSGKFDVNLSDRRVAPTDVIITYQMRPTSKLIMGYYKDPVSMENNTASKFLSVATPMAVGMLTRGERYVGVTYVHWGRKYWLSGGLYAGNLAPNNTPTANRGGDGYGISARMAYVPIDNDYTTLHIGAFGRWRKPDGTGGPIRSIALGGTPETPIDQHRFLGTIVPQTKSYVLGGGELAFKFDKFFLTGEYLFNKFNTVSGADNFVYGWTLTSSYMILGKQRKYLKGDAFFNPTGNLDHRGGLEVIGRVGSVNLNDLKNTISPLKGGASFSAMLGVNYYPLPNLLFGLNYTYTANDSFANEMGKITHKNGTQLSDGINFSALNLRAQIIF